MSIRKLLLSLLPANNRRIYNFCRQYADRYDAENNDDILTNGEMNFMKQTLADCRVIFDVGANIGDWSLLALQVNPRLIIHCFEPSPETFAQLQARLKNAACTCNPFGLGSKVEDRPLYIYADGSGNNSLFQRKGLEDGWGLSTPKRSEIIHLDTIDNYCAKNGIEIIDFMKVDVEGFEIEVFKGAAGMLKEGRIHRIQFEYGGCNIDARVLLKDIFDYFSDYPYRFCKIFPNEIRTVERYDQRLENFQYQNWALMYQGK
jgi:FkbM family methyltransferase